MDVAVDIGRNPVSKHQINLNTTVLQVTGTMQQSSPVFFLFACLIRCFRLNLSNTCKKTNNR